MTRHRWFAARGGHRAERVGSRRPTRLRSRHGHRWRHPGEAPAGVVRRSVRRPRVALVLPGDAHRAGARRAHRGPGPAARADLDGPPGPGRGRAGPGPPPTRTCVRAGDRGRTSSRAASSASSATRRSGDGGRCRDLDALNRGLPEFLHGGRVPPTPRRVVTYRWVALGLAVGWTVLLAVLIASSTTTSTPSARACGDDHALSPRTAAGVVLFTLFLLACCVVTGVGLSAASGPTPRRRAGRATWWPGSCSCSGSSRWPRSA